MTVMVVHCHACGHEWATPLTLPMPIRLAVTAMRGVVKAGCPACGAQGYAVRCGPAPAGDDSVQVRVRS